MPDKHVVGGGRQDLEVLAADDVLEIGQAGAQVRVVMLKYQGADLVGKNSGLRIFIITVGKSGRLPPSITTASSRSTIR